MDQTIGNIIAGGSLRTAAFALVDASKILGGGVSRCGFKRIMNGSEQTDTLRRRQPGVHASIEPTLWANWINGTQLADQKAVAKTLIKLR